MKYGVAIAGYAALSGCVTWRNVDEHVELRPGAPRIEPRRDLLPGTAHVLDDGRIGYALDLDTACVAVIRFDRVRDVARRHTPTPAGIVALATGGLLVAVTPALGWPLVLAAGGAALFVGTAVQLDGKHTPANHATIVERDAVTESHVAPCAHDDPPWFGELALTAPWGELATSRVDDRGIATFAVDWTRARDGAAAGLWHVDADATGAVADFVLSPADRTAASAHIRAQGGH
jgi:hypothetical protein